MKHKLLIALLSIALLPGASFAKKPVRPEKIPEPGQAVWVDANGTMLGDVQTNVGLDETLVYFGVNGKFYIVGLGLFYSENVATASFYGGELLYDQPGCMGNPYSRAMEIFPGEIISTSGIREGVFYTQGGDTPQTVEVLSKWSEDGFDCFRYGLCDEPPFYRFNCLNVLDTQPEPWVYENAYPAVPFIDTNIYTKPFRLKLTPPN